MCELQEMEDSFTPVGDSRGALPVTRRSFIGAGMASPALPLLLGSTATSAALLSSRKCESTLRFEEDANALTITWYPELEIGEQPHELGNKACAQPPKPSQATSASPERARSWRLIRKAFGPDAKFRLRLDKVDNKDPDVVYSLEVTSVRFGKLAGRTLLFKFTHRNSDPEKWSVELSTDMWGGNKASKLIAFSNLCDAADAFASSPARKVFEGEPDLPDGSALELEGVNAKTALQQIFGDDLQVKEPVRLQLATNGVWSILPAERNSQKPSPFRLADGALSLPKGLRMAWCDPDPASLEGDATSRPPSRDADEQKRDKVQQSAKPTPTGRPEKDPVFLAWGEVSQGKLLLGTTRQTPRAVLTAMPTKLKKIDRDKPANAQQKEGKKPAPATPPAGTASASEPARVPPARTWPDCVAPAPEVDWTAVAGDPADIEAFQPPQWRFLRRDWSLKTPVVAHPTGVSSVRASWTATVSTGAGEFGPIFIMDGVLQRGNTTKGANTPTLRFAGQLSTTNWEIDTCIGKLCVKGAHSDGSVIDPQTASARTHRPLMTLSSSGYADALSSLDVPLLLLRSDLAPEGCEFSEFNFAPTGLRAVYDRDAAKARNDLRVSDSYLWLGDPAALRELPLAHIDLTRARIDVARPESLARLGFMFAGLHLDVADGKAWIADRRASCRVQQRIEPSGDGEPIVLDTRPVLVAEFPPQHVFEEAVFRPSEAPLPDVVVKKDDPKDDPTFTVPLKSGEKKFSIHLPELLRQLEVLELAKDHEDVRVKYSSLKRSQDEAFGVFADEFKELCETAIANGSLPSLPERRDPSRQTDFLSPAYNIYIGPDELPPVLMAIGRAANKNIRHKLVEGLLDASLEKAERFIDLLNGKPPTTEEIGSKFFDFVTSVLAKMNPFKSTPEWPVSPRDHARLVEQATSGALQDYAFFRDFYAEWILKQHGTKNLLPDDMEYFSASNRTGLTFMSEPSVEKREEDAKTAYIKLIQNAEAPDPVMRARLSGTSRLAFHVDCGSRPHMDVEDGDAHFLAQGDVPGTRLPFSFDALTDWARYDLAVTPRAREAAAFDEGGVLIRRNVTEEGRREDDSASADVAMLKSLGIRSGQEPKRQQPGRSRDWGKKLRTLQERLTDVEASLSIIPDDLQTAIEIPARLILSPSQKGQWRTRRNNFQWAYSSPDWPIPLWTANLNVDGRNPMVRAVASPDMRPEFLRVGLDRRLFSYQRLVPNTAALHTPAGAAPPRGPRAPWTLGFEESDPNTSKIEDIFKATRSVSDGENKSEEKICAGSSTAVAPSAGAAASTALAIASTASETSAPKSAVSIASEPLPNLHPLVDYLCSRQIERKGYADNAVFRSTLDAYDRHEIVLLSSAWGLPVRGRREKTGQLQALRFSSQVELPEEWHLLDAEAGTAIYRPRALKIQELALTALGGTLRHDSDFVPPAAARHIVHGPMFDSMSVERWQQWTVLGRDVFAEVVYKGYLFPIGHRASLVKQTERIFLAPAKMGSKDPDPHAPLRCYLRQRMFIRVARPEKAFPAYGQPNGGRMFPADVARMLTLTTPDIVDPTEDTTLPQAASAGEMMVSPGGRLYANEAGLVFWPRTARIAGAEVAFDVQIQGAATKAKLIFVDNVAVNRPDLMDRLVQDYNALPSPDLTSNDQVDLRSPDLQKHLRTLDLHSQSLRYCDEIKPGSASHKTLSWTLKATGGVGVTNMPRPLDQDLVPNKYEGHVHLFDDPLLEGADQPPFYPAIQTARIRIDQVERLTGGSPQAAVAQFEGWYVRNGFERDKRTQETDQLGIYMDIVNKVTMDMGSNGSRSGGVMRPAGEVIALSRERGPLTGTGRLDKAGVIDTVVDKESGFPLTPAPAPAPQRAFGPNSETADVNHAKKAFDKFFSGNDTLKTKILGLVSVSDLVEFLDVKNAAAELPLLREVVEYGMSGAEGAADSLRANVIAPLHDLILELGRQWDEAGRSVKERSGGLFNGMGDVFPDVNSALQDLKNVLSATSDNTDDAAFLAALSGIYECGRRLMDACGRVANNPLDQLQVAVKQKLEGFNKQIEGFIFRPDQLSPKTLMLAVYGYLPEFEKRLMVGAFARLQNLQARLKTLRDALDKNATDVLARVEELQKVLKDAETGITAALKNTIDRAPGPGTQKTPLLQAEDLLLSMVKEFDGAINNVQPQLAAIKTEPGSAADKALRDFTTALVAAQAHTAATLAEWSSSDLIARSEYRRAVANLATLLRLYTTVRAIEGNPESLLAQVSQVLLDYLTAQIGPRRPDFPQLEVEARNLLTGVLEPIRGGAKKVLAGIVNTELVFPPAPLPDLNKKNALDKWPVSAGGNSVVEKLQAVARKAHVEVLSSKLKDPQFKPVREQLARLGTAALAAQVILHRAAIGVQLPLPQSEPFDIENLQASMQRIDSALRDLERLGDSAVLALRKLQEDLIAISQKQARDALTEPVREAIGSIIQWFLDLNGTLQAKVSDAAKKVEPKSFLQPWLALLDEYGVRISSARTLVANTTEWIDDPSKLLPALRDPMDAARQTGIQAVLMLQQALVDKAMDWAASFVVPVEAAADELKTVFAPLLELLKKSYAELEVQRKNVLETAGTTAGQLLMGAMLVGVDKNVIFVTGKLPDDSQTDASAPDKDQLHWDTQSLEHLLKVKLSTLQDSEQLRAFNFMNYLVTGWRNGQATPLRIVEQLKRLSLEEIRARLVALINFGAIREEIEERIKLLIPSAVTMSYDFSTTMSAQAQEATAGVFRPKQGCALTVRTRARVDLLQANAPTFLSIGELGAFDIRLLGSFDAVTLHFKGVRFTSRGGSPECDLQYEGFTIGEKLEYLSQLTPFFGSKAGSGFYLQPLDSGIGVEAGYRLDLGAFTVGNLAIFNVSLNAAARLPFDNRSATFVASLSRRDSPFTIAIAPYGGSGFFALEADTKGIVGFEVSFEYGGAGAFAYGPLSGQGRLMVGAYIRSRYDHTEIFATFYVGGTASIWIFNFGASLYVNAKQEGSQMKGTATYTFSFSMGIVDYDYKVAVNVALSLDGSSDNKAQKKQADRTVSGDARRWQDETPPVRLASLEGKWSPGDVVSDVATHPLAMMFAAGATSAVRKPANQGASMTTSKGKRRVATKCQTESWSTYSSYFDKDLAKKVQKLKAVY